MILDPLPLRCFQVATEQPEKPKPKPPVHLMQDARGYWFPLPKGMMFGSQDHAVYLNEIGFTQDNCAKLTHERNEIERIWGLVQLDARGTSND